MTYKTLGKICLAISVSSIVYMFLITYEGTSLGWTVFFVFLAFAILFQSLDEQSEEIEILRSPKKGMEINQLSEIKRIQFLGSPFQSKQTEKPKEQKEEKIEESEIQFIPTLYPGMEKKFRTPPKKDKPPQNNDKN